VAVKIYGASDDLIEVEGDIRDELSAYDLDDGAAVACSDGTLLGVSYDGRWRFTLISKGSASFDKIEATEDEGSRPDGTPAYSDVVVLDGHISWVALTTKVVRP